MDRDWDNLLILDGCRADTFREVCSLDGRFQTVISGGSSSVGFMRHNFTEQSFPDTVYVSANPFVTKLDLDDNFHATWAVWGNEWNDEYKTILPRDVAAAAHDAHDAYPNKRLIVHFMQPHVPFIGDLGRRIEQRGILGEDEETPRVWDRLRQGTVNARTARAAYRENLELVLPYVAELMQELGGRSVVTADHGNVFGRLGVYGHPHDTYLSGLVEVPWFVTNRGERRQIVAGETGAEMPTVGNSDELAQRLAHLGYIDE
jgi:hypothetical protein